MQLPQDRRTLDVMSQYEALAERGAPLTRAPAVALAAALLLATATGCDSGGKAGGSAPKHTSVIKLVTTWVGADPQLHVYSDAVARRSHGSLRIAIEPNYLNSVPAEKRLLRDVE